VSSALFEAVSRIARHEATSRLVASIGRVLESHDAGGPDGDHAVTLELRDSGLRLPRVPIAVGALGYAALPAPGDLVVVVFLEGDANAPIVVGSLYHSELGPPAHSTEEIALRLPAGATEPDITIVARRDGSSLEISFRDERRVRVDEEVVELSVGEMKVRAETSGGGRVGIVAGGAEILLKMDGDIAISTKGKLRLEGSEVEISGQTSVKVNGATVELN